MDRVIVLPDDVANQIAAGEVVERPASVIKELVENALDAEATRIRVQIDGGGQRRILVSDDGYGLSRGDAERALLRHATSKLRTAHDLLRIRSFGFRGEALPSIAAVSRLTLITRARGESEGTKIVVEGGKTTEIVAAGAPEGTSIEVEDLFYNVPARRKFLKQPATEVGHAEETVTRLALAQPQVGFVMETEGRRVLEAPASPNDPRGRLGRLLGRALADRLHPLSPQEGPVMVRGFVSEPSHGERSPRALYTFVNGRFVRDRTIQHAIQDAYRGLIEDGRYPVVVLFLELDPESFDVNVHPQKLEVRFLRTGEIHRAITTTIVAALNAQPWVPGPPPATLDQMVTAAVTLRPQPAPTFSTAKERGRWIDPSAFQPVTHERPRYDYHSAPKTVPVPTPGRFVHWQPLAPLLGRWFLCQAPEGLVLLDPAAAHEKILATRLVAAWKAGPVAVQPLLVPLSLELQGDAAELAQTQAESLAQHGFELEPFGGRTFVLKSAPALLSQAPLAPLVLELLDAWAEHGAQTPFTQHLEQLAARAAQKAAVGARTRLAPDEIRQLLSDMDSVAGSSVGLEGRRVYIEWTRAELEQLFSR